MARSVRMKLWLQYGFGIAAGGMIFTVFSLIILVIWHPDLNLNVGVFGVMWASASLILGSMSPLSILGWGIAALVVRFPLYEWKLLGITFVGRGREYRTKTWPINTISFFPDAATTVRQLKITAAGDRLAMLVLGGILVALGPVLRKSTPAEEFGAIVLGACLCSGSTLLGIGIGTLKPQKNSSPFLLQVQSDAEGLLRQMKGLSAITRLALNTLPAERTERDFSQILDLWPEGEDAVLDLRTTSLMSRGNWTEVARDYEVRSEQLSQKLVWTEFEHVRCEVQALIAAMVFGDVIGARAWLELAGDARTDLYWKEMALASIDIRSMAPAGREARFVEMRRAISDGEVYPSRWKNMRTVMDRLFSPKMLETVPVPRKVDPPTGPSPYPRG